MRGDQGVMLMHSLSFYSWQAQCPNAERGWLCHEIENARFRQGVV